MPVDRHGLPVTTTSPDALDAYNQGVRGLLSWDRHTLERFTTAAERDPGLALAHAGAAVCLFLDERFKEGRAAAETARSAAGAQTARERGHVEALALFVTGQAPQAERAMREHLASYPRDLVILQRLYFILFWQGRFPEMLELTRDLLRHYVLLEACFRAGEMDRAERLLGERLARRPDHFWQTRRAGRPDATEDRR
ncbi:MAG: hypothetical protein ACRELA_23340 [Candidatus Rokuibacteriota bacterium]